MDWAGKSQVVEGVKWGELLKIISFPDNRQDRVHAIGVTLT